MRLSYKYVYVDNEREEMFLALQNGSGKTGWKMKVGKLSGEW